MRARMELLQARNRVIGRHPKTQFIGAHVANNAEDLKRVSQWLDRYPNLYVEPSSRISELGRQPFTSRDFLLKYQPMNDMERTLYEFCRTELNRISK